MSKTTFGKSNLRSSPHRLDAIYFFLCLLFTKSEALATYVSLHVVAVVVVLPNAAIKAAV